jgi:hypothetical protein
MFYAQLVPFHHRSLWSKFYFGNILLMQVDYLKTFSTSLPLVKVLNFLQRIEGTLSTWTTHETSIDDTEWIFGGASYILDQNSIDCAQTK